MPYMRIRVIKKRRKRGQKKRTEGWKLVGGTFVNVAPLTSAETRRKKGEREREREREREKGREGKKRWSYTHERYVRAHSTYGTGLFNEVP